MNSILIKNCHLISPDVDIEKASILLEGKFIRKILLSGEEVSADLVYDAGNNYVMPGFIDIHFHGVKGFDVAHTDMEGMGIIAEAKLKEGVTTIIPTIETVSEERLPEIMKTIASYISEKKVKTSAAKIAGVHLEGPYINSEYIGALNPNFVRTLKIEEVLRLNSIVPVKIVSFAIEQEGCLELVSQLAANTIVPSCGHSSAGWDIFKKARAKGLKHLTHFSNRMRALHHREIGLVGAGLLDSKVILELIGDNIHLCPEMLELVFKLKPIEGIVLITDSAAVSGLSDGEYELGAGTVKLEKGVPRLVSSGALAGSTLEYNRGLKNVYELTGIPLKELVKTTSFNQACSIGLEKKGKIEPGYFADIIVLNEEFELVQAFLEGNLC